jgi:hypothetical protein
MQEDKLTKAFKEAIQAESLLKYGLPYNQLCPESQKAIREVVKDYFTQKIYDLTEEE